MRAGGAVARGVPGVPVEPVSCGVMAEVPPVWRPRAGGPSVHPRSVGRDREAECAADLVRADRRIGRRSTAASDWEGPLNGPEAGHIGRISREARPSPGARPARGQAPRRPLTPPVAVWAAVCGGVAVLPRRRDRAPWASGGPRGGAARRCCMNTLWGWGRASWAGCGPDVRRGGHPEIDADHGIFGR